MKKVKIGLVLVAFCAASISAQVKVTPPKVTVTAPAVEAPAHAAPAAPAVAAPVAPAAPHVAAPEAPATPAAHVPAPEAPAAPAAHVPAAPAVAAPATPAIAAPAVAAPAAPAPAAPAVHTPAAPATPEPAAHMPAAPAVHTPALEAPALEAPALEAPEAEIAEPAPEAPVAEVPPAPEPPKVEPAPAPVVLPPVPSEPSNIKFHLGARVGLGLSAMRDHRSLGISNPYTPEGYPIYNRAIPLYPALSFGFGIAFAFEFNNLFTLAPELQYTRYRANGSFVLKNGNSFPYYNEAGTNLDAFELPILARFNFASGALGDQSNIYIEVGPQVGYSYSAIIYRNSEYQKPETNAFAFGPTLGFGANVSETLIGIRGHFGLLEYAKNTKGKPWTAQVSITKFFF